jgi:hypothetical protein
MDFLGKEGFFFLCKGPFAIQTGNMRRLYLFILFSLILAGRGAALLAGEFQLSNGDVLKGEPSSFSDQGVVVRLDIGGFSERVGYGKFTQESLKELAKSPNAKNFVKPFIEIPKEVKEKQRAKKKEIVLKPVPRVERPTGKQHFFASLAGPTGIFLLIVLYAANLYAAFEIAAFRNRPPALVCGVSAILPFLGPLIFLAVPTEEQGPSEYATSQPAASTEGAPEPAKAAAGGGGLGIASHEKPKGTSSNVGESFKRGDNTFNRRFFESKFPGFFRVVPSEAEKDLVLAIITPKGDHLAKRISRISMNEMHILTSRGGSEVNIPFGEIIEVQVRHKDAKA